MIETRGGTSTAASDEPEATGRTGEAQVESRRARVDERRAAARRRALIWVVGAIAVAGVLVRLWLAYGRLGGVDSDEAVTGLMGLHILRNGQFPAFYWGQQYGGTLDAYLLAPLFWILGTSTFVLKIPVLVLGFGASYLTWRVARRLMTDQQAVVAGLLSLFWPMGIVWKATKENGFYSATAVLGLAGWLLALQLNEDPRSRWRWAAFGLVFGVGWWESPNVAYFAAPIAIWLLLHGHGKRIVELLCAAAGFVVGGGVWIVCNLRSGFAGLDVPSSWAGTSTYASRFRFFFTHGLPFALGLRRPWDSAWAFGSTLTPWIYGAVLLVIFVIVIRRGIQLRPEAFAFLIMPFLFAYFIGNWTLADGRYLFFVATLLPFLMAQLWRGWIPKLALGGFAVATFISFLFSVSFLQGSVRPTTVPMADRLESLGYHSAVAEYWIAFQMSFQSDERVIATPLDASARYPGYVRAVKNSNSAYVYHRGTDGPAIAAMVNKLTSENISYRIVTVGAFTAILPDRRVTW